MPFQGYKGFQTYGSDRCAANGCARELPPNPADRDGWFVKFSTVLCPEHVPTAPVRSCCGQPHAGVQCPDGLVMCQLCFDRFPLSSLNQTPDGDLENVCKACAADEQRPGGRRVLD